MELVVAGFVFGSVFAALCCRFIDEYKSEQKKKEKDEARRLVGKNLSFELTPIIKEISKKL